MTKDVIIQLCCYNAIIRLYYCYVIIQLCYYYVIMHVVRDIQLYFCTGIV